MTSVFMEVLFIFINRMPFLASTLDNANPLFALVLAHRVSNPLFALVLAHLVSNPLFALVLAHRVSIAPRDEQQG